MKIMIELEEALEFVLSRIQPIETECVSISDTYKRVLARDVTSLISLLSYREGRDLLTDKARRDPYDFGYFTEDDGADYGKHLAQYHTLTNYW